MAENIEINQATDGNIDIVSEDISVERQQLFETILI